MIKTPSDLTPKQIKSDQKVVIDKNVPKPLCKLFTHTFCVFLFDFTCMHSFHFNLYYSLKKCLHLLVLNKYMDGSRAVVV